MFNGKRSHSLIGLLATVCALYLTRLKRPSWPVLITHRRARCTGRDNRDWLARKHHNYQRTVAGFVQYLADFQPEKILVNLNVKDDDDGAGDTSRTRRSNTAASS